MDYILVCLASLVGAGLTLFSGFGLGTILLPVFGLFFPIEIAIVLTAIVHFLNNLFKLFLFGKNANRYVIIKFGLPAILFAFIGAYLLEKLTHTTTLSTFEFQNISIKIQPLKLVVGILLIVFSLFDLIPQLKKLEFDKKYLSVGGIMSGFFGGISGHQGALRSAFLVRAGLTKNAYVATGVVIACMVDVSRLTVYIPQIVKNHTTMNFKIISVATLSAFLGVYIGNKLLEKTTFTMVQSIVALFLFTYGILLIMGII